MASEPYHPLPYPVVAVRANDWRLYTKQFTITDELPFTPVPSWIVGSLIFEDDNCLTVALELFEKDARCALVIQKTCILERIDCVPMYMLKTD